VKIIKCSEEYRKQWKLKKQKEEEKKEEEKVKQKEKEKKSKKEKMIDVKKVVKKWEIWDERSKEISKKIISQVNQSFQEKI